MKETVKTAGGWGGAAAAITIYNTATGSTNVAGPWAWAGNAVGNIVAGGFGYFAGSQGAEAIYEMTVERLYTHND